MFSLLFWDRSLSICTIFIYNIFWWTKQDIWGLPLRMRLKNLHHVPLIIHLNARWLVLPRLSFFSPPATFSAFFVSSNFSKIDRTNFLRFEKLCKSNALFFTRLQTNWTLSVFVFGGTVTDHHQNWKVMFFLPQLHRSGALKLKYVPLFFSSVWSCHHAFTQNV